MTNIRVNYYRGVTITHSHDEAWEQLALFCPNCGQQKVWHDTSDGDYYVGELHICTGCNHGFYLPNGVFDESNDQQGQQRIKSIKDKSGDNVNEIEQ